MHGKAREEHQVFSKPRDPPVLAPTVRGYGCASLAAYRGAGVSHPPACRVHTLTPRAVSTALRCSMFDRTVVSRVSGVLSIYRHCP